MTYRPHIFAALISGSALLATACSVAPPITEQEQQIKTDLAADRFLPATRQMRDAIETQQLFAQAAFWSNEYHLNPTDLEAALKLSSAVRKLGNPGRAVEITQHTRALYPRDPYLIAEYGAALIASERAKDAIPILTKGLSIAPNYGRMWSLKGAALDQQERYAEARQHYDRALRITPNDPNIMANLGLSHALSGDPKTAEGWLRRAYSIPNASESVKQNLILVLKLQGKTAEAESLEGLSPQQFNSSQIRQVYNSNPATQQNVRPVAAPPSPQPFNFNQSGAPQARLQTGTSQGQQFTSASQAVRAIAEKRAAQTKASTPNGATPGKQSYSQAYPQQPYSQGYPQSYTASQTQATDRRVPNRRRR